LLIRDLILMPGVDQRERKSNHENCGNRSPYLPPGELSLGWFGRQSRQYPFFKPASRLGIRSFL